MCDQLRAFELGCYGHPTVRTPNIDRMARNGAQFSVWCSNSPLCVPARNVLLSGQYGRTCAGTNSNYVGFPPSRRRVRCVDPTLPEVLREAGYHTALVGKWHVHPAPDLVGFDRAVYPHNLHRHYGQTFYDQEGKSTKVEGFSLDYEMEQVRGIVREQRDDPFFLLYSLSPPHMPLLDAPRRYTEMYSRSDVVLRDNVWVDGRLAHDLRWFRLYLWDYLGYLPDNLTGHEAEMSEDYEQRNQERPLHGLRRVYRDIRALLDDPRVGEHLRESMPYLDENLLDGLDLKDLTAIYYGMVTCVDDRVGELFECLDAEGVADDTLVIFTSDHGDMLGSHHLWNKAYLYEESVRIPLIYHWPGGMAAPGIEAQVGGLVDVMPTVLSLAGIPSPSTIQGTDLSPVLEGQMETAGRNLAFIEAYKQGAIGVRSATHMFGIPVEGDDEAGSRPAQAGHLFYDLRTDPFQQTNLAAQGEQAE